MSQPQPEPPWYSEEAGFFGPNYLEEYAHVLPPERTEREVAFVDNINDEIRKITPPGQPARVFDCGRPDSLWVVAIVHWLLCGLSLVLAFKK